MKKMIKKSVQMRLDELVKYIFDNDIRGGHFSCCTEDTHIKVFYDGRVYSNYAFSKSDTFTVEVEEEITEDTVFDRLIEIDIDGGYWDHGHNISIDDVKDEDSLRFYAVINRKLELIWEAE